MTITTNKTDRKALARAIAEELGTTAKYMGIPSYAYQIGDFTVDHDGNIIGEDFGALQDFLRRNGYLSDELAVDQEAPADSEAEHVTRMDISIPAHNATVTQLKNLIFMLHSRQTLINRMTESDCLSIPDIRIFQQWKAGTDFKALRIAAMKECSGLTQIWEEPFQALYTVADGEIVIRFRQNNDAVEVAADHLTKAK